MKLHTKQQWLVFESPGVHFIGYDEAERPVVEATRPFSSRSARWAVKRDGDPTDITGNVRPCKYHGPPR